MSCIIMHDLCIQIHWFRDPDGKKMFSKWYGLWVPLLGNLHICWGQKLGKSQPAGPGRGASLGRWRVMGSTSAGWEDQISPICSSAAGSFPATWQGLKLNSEDQSGYTQTSWGRNVLILIPPWWIEWYDLGPMCNHKRNGNDKVVQWEVLQTSTRHL